MHVFGANECFCCGVLTGHFYHSCMPQPAASPAATVWRTCAAATASSCPACTFTMLTHSPRTEKLATALTQLPMERWCGRRPCTASSTRWAAGVLRPTASAFAQLHMFSQCHSVALTLPHLQPFSLRNYPVDSFNFVWQLVLTDTSRSVAGHPGLQLVPSAASVEVRHQSAGGRREKSVSQKLAAAAPHVQARSNRAARKPQPACNRPAGSTFRTYHRRPHKWV